MSQGYDELLDHYVGASAEAYFIRDAIDGWKRFRDCNGRNSIWRTKEGKEIKIKDLETSHIEHILTYNFPKPLPEDCRSLLEAELTLRGGVIEELEKELSKYEEIIAAGDLAFG